MDDCLIQKRREFPYFMLVLWGNVTRKGEGRARAGQLGFRVDSSEHSSPTLALKPGFSFATPKSQAMYCLFVFSPSGAVELLVTRSPPPCLTAPGFRHMRDACICPHSSLCPLRLCGVRHLFINDLKSVFKLLKGEIERSKQ